MDLFTLLWYYAPIVEKDGTFATRCEGVPLEINKSGFSGRDAEVPRTRFLIKDGIGTSVTIAYDTI